TDRDPAFDDLTSLAAQICGAPIALVGLVDSRREWIKSRVGLAIVETPRDVSFSAHAILQTDPLILPDASRDERFAENPQVTGEPKVRFYAGAPLITPQGQAVGALCVMDRVARTITAQQVEALKTLAHQIVTHLELRVHVEELEREAANHQRTEQALRQTEAKYRSIFENVVEGIFQTSPE